MDSVCLEGNENQYVTSPNGEALVRNVNARRSGRIRNSPLRYNPGFGAAREWNNDDVASIVYMIQYRNLNINVDAVDILLLIDEWEAKYCIDTSSTFNMKKYFVLNYQKHDPDTQRYMDAFSGKNVE